MSMTEFFYVVQWWWYRGPPTSFRYILLFYLGESESLVLNEAVAKC